MIHPSAIIDPGAQIGEGTKIWHFCHVDSGAIIGKNCSIGQGCYIASGSVIGDNVRIQNNVSIYSGVTLEDFVFIGPSVVFTNVRRPCGYKKSTFERTLVKYGSVIGANSTIICGVTIGPLALIAAGSVVTKSVGYEKTVMGNPARIKK